ncbi:YopX family protein [Caldifermentibacillus hisashii]|uniref:YopX family protein n=1 Tax=Caldifermentibacillus hisashii TaxID=996558 RepID=UPI0031016A53
MREIKFQVFTEDWKGVKKCFDCYYLYLLEEIPLSFGTPKDGRWYKVAFTNSEGDKETVVVDRDKIRMFTGLKDKNGKEIYEGDIVEFNNCDYQRTAGHLDDEIIVGEVEYSCGVWGLKEANGQLHDLYISLVNDEEAEVIGNIYENPELLEGGE